MWLRTCLGAIFALGLFFAVVLPASADPAAEQNASRLPSTLPPTLFLGRTAEAYGVAAEIPEVLAGLACYCGCDRSNGHRHLLDCFADDHGAG
jgi:hypothetical protein